MARNKNLNKIHHYNQFLLLSLIVFISTQFSKFKGINEKLMKNKTFQF
jgi:hypothetical protein